MNMKIEHHLDMALRQLNQLSTENGQLKLLINEISSLTDATVQDAAAKLDTTSRTEYNYNTGRLNIAALINGIINDYKETNKQ
jgi:hypothetical protein